jgi:hypothetical protein
LWTSFLLYVPRTQIISFSLISSPKLYMLRRANLEAPRCIKTYI